MIKFSEEKLAKVKEIIDFCTTINPAEDKKIILVTGHRRENFGQGFEDPVPIRVLIAGDVVGLAKGLGVVRPLRRRAAAAHHRERGAAQQLAPEFVNALHEETDGNPFFAEEVVTHLVETGAIFQRDGADLFCRVPISLVTASLGGEVTVLGGLDPEPDGYDLRGAFIGSEGMCGIATKICVNSATGR